MLSPRCGKISASTHNKEVKISTHMLVEGCHFSPAALRAFTHSLASPKWREHVAGGPKSLASSSFVKRHKWFKLCKEEEDEMGLFELSSTGETCSHQSN